MPRPIPIRLLMNRKLALAVARMLGGTMCWTAAMTGPEPGERQHLADREQDPADRQ